MREDTKQFIGGLAVMIVMVVAVMTPIIALLFTQGRFGE